MANNIDFNTPPSTNESGILTRLWRKIIKDNNLTSYLPMLVDQYVNETHMLDDQDTNKAKDPATKALKRKSKSTMINNITANEMTFKTFMDLVFNLLKVKRITLSVKITFNNGDENVHSVVIDNNKGKKDEKSNTGSNT